MEPTAPGFLSVTFIGSEIDFPHLRWILNAHFNRLSLAAFHPHTLWQGLSSHFFGNSFPKGNN
jgi:hypothetical protein